MANRQPFISDVILARRMGTDPIVTLTAPVQECGWVHARRGIRVPALRALQGPRREPGVAAGEAKL